MYLKSKLMRVCCDTNASNNCITLCFLSVLMVALLSLAQPGLVISHHADHTLSSFCQWQSGLMGKDGTRHDHAILLTGLDICSWKNEPCDTLGKIIQQSFEDHICAMHLLWPYVVNSCPYSQSISGSHC